MTSPATVPNFTPAPDSGQDFDCLSDADFDSISAIIDSLCLLPSVQDLLRDIGAKRMRVGRKGYSVVSMFRCFFAKYMISERYTTRLIERLWASQRLREICGLTGIPSEPTFSRFFKRLAQEPERLEPAIVVLVEMLREFFPDLGKRLAIDSTDISAWAKPFRKQGPSDPDAKTGVRTAKSKSVGDDGLPKKMEYFFGYKSHLICDSIVGIPLAQVFLPANEPDTSQLPDVLNKALDAYPWLKKTTTHMTADKGYDARSNFAFLIEKNIEPVILSRRPTAADSLYNGIFNKDGLPMCDDGVTPMEYVGSEGNRHMFRCPATGCAMKSRTSGAMRFCDTTALWIESTPDNARALGWKTPKASAEWKSLYAERPIIERLFGSMKTSRILNQHQYRTGKKVETHVNLAILCYLGTMLGRAKSGEFEKIRHMRVKLG